MKLLLLKQEDTSWLAETNQNFKFEILNLK